LLILLFMPPLQIPLTILFLSLMVISVCLLYPVVKGSLTENHELRDKLKQMEKKKIVQMRCWQMCCH
jgi:membrane protein implicated in regulation of membrane protease activity